ncbi:MAG: alpha-L-fucosidase [Anaerolineae bacterium]|nr:alpha-L-fucosidase [Anaerolineae bacterium]
MTYQPTLESVKTHPLPDWYHDAKFGIFIHWGVYSVPAYAPSGEMDMEKLLKGGMDFSRSPYAEWYQNSLRIEGSPTFQHHAKTYGPGFGYEQFATQFNDQLPKWEPESWANLFARAGARYVVLVTKHHDGFLMWNSRHPNPHIEGWQTSRDVVGELSHALSAEGLKMGLYYSSLLDWSFTGKPITSLAELVAGSDTSRRYVDYVESHWLELIERYDPWILWSDIGYPPGYDLPKLWARFYNGKPEGVVNDRWMQLPRVFFSRLGRAVLMQMIRRMAGGKPPQAPHCDFVTPEYATLDTITPHKWETCRGIGNSFGFNQSESAEDYQKAVDLVRLLADIVSKNGNLLLNVGPCADGTIHPAQLEALEGLGGWLKANGESIYGTRPWLRWKDEGASGGEVRYTSKERTLYAIVTKLPANGVLSLPPDIEGDVTLLETREMLKVDRLDGHCRITLPAMTSLSIPVIRIQQKA